MKRSSSPENDDGPAQKCPAQKRLTKKRVRQLRQVQIKWNQFYKQVDTSGKVIWSGTMEIADSQKIVCDSSFKVPSHIDQDDEGIKSLFPQKQLIIHILPLSVWVSLHPYEIQVKGAVLFTDENTDMMSYSAFSQAIRFDRKMNELENQNATLKEELQNKDKMLNEQQRLNQELVEIHKKEMAEKEEELIRLHQEVEEQKKLAEKKQEELATSQNGRDMMKKAINEKDAEIIVKDITLMENNETLMSLRQKIMELQNEKEQVEEELHKVLMKDRCWDAERELFQETNQSNIEEDADKILMMVTSRLELQNEVTMKQAALDEIDKMMVDDFKCSICSQLFIKTTTLNCSHSFCAFCIQKWLSEKGTCPHCRSGVTASVRSVVLDNLIETIIDKLGDEAKERRKVTVREREYDISMQKGRHLCSIPEDVETEDETSTVSSPCSSLSHLSPSVSLMSPYSCPPSSASTWSRSPASIANMFSSPSALSTNSPSPACNGLNN